MFAKKQFIKLCFIILAPLGYIALYAASFKPEMVEAVYSQGLYRVLIKSVSILTGIFPFSVIEILMFSLLVFILLKTAFFIVNVAKGREKGLLKSFINGCISIIAALCTVYFLFIVMCGLNYQRLSFSEIVHYNMESPSLDELIKVCRDLTVQANELRESVEEDENRVAKLSTGIDDTLKRAGKGYEIAGKLVPELSGNFGRPKGVIISPLMSFTGIEGMYSPFTGEANVNVAIPQFDIPFTACHEMAHQRGFLREDEANYIAYLVCISHPDKDFQYSGALAALIYATNALYKTDRENYKIIRQSFSDGVNRDLKAINIYWQKYDTPVQEFSSSVNDTYLKANMQKDGVKSYGRMVDLLIASRRVDN